MRFGRGLGERGKHYPAGFAVHAYILVEVGIRSKLLIHERRMKLRPHGLKASQKFGVLHADPVGLKAGA